MAKKPDRTTKIGITPFAHGLLRHLRRVDRRAASRIEAIIAELGAGSLKREHLGTLAASKDHSERELAKVLLASQERTSSVFWKELGGPSRSARPSLALVVYAEPAAAPYAVVVIFVGVLLSDGRLLPLEPEL